MIPFVRAMRSAVLATLLATTTLALAAPAEAGDGPVWVRQFGTAVVDEANAVATDTAGNIFLAGQTTGALGGPENGDIFDDYDAWVMKLDANRRVLWKRQLGTAYDDGVSGVATDLAGNVYLAGYTGGTLGYPYTGIGFVWVGKYDTAGHLIWKRQFGTTVYDVVAGVATDAAGNVYVAGYTGGSLGGPNRGQFDSWLAKLDSAGHFNWKRQLGTRQYDDAFGVAADTAGNVYIAGRTYGALGGPKLGGSGDTDAWWVKYDSAGKQLWKRQIGTAKHDDARGVATDTAGNVYIAGMTYGALGGPGSGSGDTWVAKYDATGRLQWSQQFETFGGLLTGVATDAAGSVYLTGYTQGSLGGPFQGGYRDAWVAKYDTTGNPQWTRQLGTAEYDWANGVATDASGGVYIAGWTFGSLSGANAGDSDAFIAKYSAQP